MTTITIDRAVVEQALEELEKGAIVSAAITLRAALAEPAQEPSESSCDECGKSKADGWALYCVECLEQFFHPTETAQEPAAWMHPDGRVVPAATMNAARSDGGASLSSVRDYTIPLLPQRPPLTDEEISDIYIDWDITPGRRIADLVRAIERKLKGG